MRSLPPRDQTQLEVLVRAVTRSGDWKTQARHVTIKVQSDPVFASALRLDARALLEVSPDFAHLSATELFDFLLRLRAQGVPTPNCAQPGTSLTPWTGNIVDSLGAWRWLVSVSVRCEDRFSF